MAMLVATTTRQILRAYLSPPIRNEALQGLARFTRNKRTSAPSDCAALYRRAAISHFVRHSANRRGPFPSSLHLPRVTADLFLPRRPARARAPPRKSKHRGRGEPPPYIKRLIRRRVVREYRRKFDETPARAFPDARRPTRKTKCRNQVHKRHRRGHRGRGEGQEERWGTLHAAEDAR